ncbi:uncharacterized protein (DUF58 family) [Ruminiclostridium sufflavum DSM 19573]|uniref:Uncharacterized protein (DUF58 family) n=1 Tax=Ruminiclostridium sufflavum DSM 19573 TaxID=1121337 RepID=A0A318XLM7_9FIRM|nr:DUF58 domain-containing protein [Ruminiclostridium sufflavum]PYG87308.1 uncharacterized protein (DUF58 family) [Ruminiclostridium sufflavum DSM 19573]
MFFLQIALTLPLMVLAEIMLYRYFNLRGMTYKRTLSESAVFEGEKIFMVEDIENNNFLPIAWMKAESLINPNLRLGAAKNIQTSQGGYHRSVFSIMPFYRLRRTYEMTCMLRGDYSVGNVTITAGDIFGLMSKIVTYDNETRLLVYPKPLNMEEMVKCFHSLQGDAVVRRFINPDPFFVAGVREYQTGDPMYSVNWKATARTNSLQVYKYDYTANSNIIILFNIDADSRQDLLPNEEEGKRIEYGIHFCAAVVERMISLGIATGFCSNGHFREEEDFVSIPSRCSRPQLYTVFEALAKLRLNRAISFHTLIKTVRNTIPKETDVLIISLYTDERIEEEIFELRRSGHQVEKWVIPEGEV